MKRINRKNILITLETARQGYSSLLLIAHICDDILMVKTCEAHHKLLNEQIVELGGESVDVPFSKNIE